MHVAIRTALAAGVVFAVFAGFAANAADLPRNRAVPAAPVLALAPPPFTGAYLGAQIGAVGLGDRARTLSAFGDADLWRTETRGSSLLGAIHGGYDWRAGNFVYGLRGEVSAFNARSSGADIFGIQYYNRALHSGAAMARVGYAFDRFMIYGLAGFSLSGAHRTQWANGWRQDFKTIVLSPTLGLGVEYAINENWRVSAQYRFSGVGAYQPQNVFGAPGLKTRHDAAIGQTTIGVSYAFGGR